MTENAKTDHPWVYSNKYYRFQDLMRNRVHDILLVSSLYDSYILEEDGRIDERLISEYIDLNITHLPAVTRVETATEALELARQQQRFDLVITTMRLGDMDAVEFAAEMRKINPHMPIVMLSYDYRDLKRVIQRTSLADFDKVFVWQGDFRILLAIVKFVEDRRNVEEDTKRIGVQSIILIEDNVRFYSSYLPLFYTELMYQCQRVLSDSINQSHRLLRMRARPKILLCSTYEEAWEYYQRYHENILGVISDVEFPRLGKSDPEAGIAFSKSVRERHPDIPILLQSHNPEIKKTADQLGVAFLQKDSPTLLQDLRQFMTQYLSFGDFVFREPDGKEVDRAGDLRSLEEKLRKIPDESLLYHAERNHFSNWLKARTEFWLADRLRPRKVSDYQNLSELRAHLIFFLRDLRHRQQLGSVIDFDASTFDPSDSFARIGGGSLGGKGRGLGFAGTLIDTYNLRERFPGMRITVPPAVVIGTDGFDQFLEGNKLRDFALKATDDNEIRKRFIEAKLSKDIQKTLRSFLELINYPLVVRSSSLLEDSQQQPFAGVYGTYFLPNNERSTDKRLKPLMEAVKCVYASMFQQRAKAYMNSTSYRLEEEKMAVVIQRLVGVQHQNRFYPDFSGVLRSHNYYPHPPMKADDGIAAVALGLGQTVLEGGAAVRFCPKYPRHPFQFENTVGLFNYSQKQFVALDLDPKNTGGSEKSLELNLNSFDLTVAEQDDVLSALASTYSRENDAVYDGTSRAGTRLVTFAPILRQNLYPLAEILQELLEIGCKSMSAQVEIEFAANLSVEKNQPKEFSIVQMRPMAIGTEWEEVHFDKVARGNLICESKRVLGNGIINNIRDIVMVDVSNFKRSESRKVAQELRILNHKLCDEDVPYILIGVGRWGSADPLLGIPVDWEYISGARVIIESGFKDLKVTPSQGTHLFQNIVSLEVGFFTVSSESEDFFIGWDWLLAQEPFEQMTMTRHLRFSRSAVVKMDGRHNYGIILKPGA